MMILVISGSAGIAFALSVAAAKNVIQLDDNFAGRIESAFRMDVADVSFSNGVAGMLVSLLNCKRYISEDSFERLVNGYMDVLLRAQLVDGSWSFIDPRYSGAVKFTGISSGVSEEQ